MDLCTYICTRELQNAVPLVPLAISLRMCVYVCMYIQMYGVMLEYQKCVCALVRVYVCKRGYACAFVYVYTQD
jgi:hypothetical protein